MNLQLPDGQEELATVRNGDVGVLLVWIVVWLHVRGIGGEMCVCVCGCASSRWELWSHT